MATAVLNPRYYGDGKAAVMVQMESDTKDARTGAMIAAHAAAVRFGLVSSNEVSFDGLRMIGKTAVILINPQQATIPCWDEDTLARICA